MSIKWAAGTNDLKAIWWKRQAWVLVRYAGNTHRFGNVEELGDGVNFNKQIKLVTEKERSFPKVFAAGKGRTLCSGAFTSKRWKETF